MNESFEVVEEQPTRVHERPISSANGAAPAIITDISAAWEVADNAEYKTHLFDGSPYGINGLFWLHELSGENRAKAKRLIRGYTVNEAGSHFKTDDLDEYAEEKLFAWGARTGEAEDSPYLFDVRRAVDASGRRLTVIQLLGMIQDKYNGPFLKAAAEKVQEISGLKSEDRSAAKND